MLRSEEVFLIRVACLLKAAESLEPEALAIKQSMRADLENVLDTLTPKESGILRLRYGLDNGVQMTLKQVGKIFKVGGWHRSDGLESYCDQSKQDHYHDQSSHKKYGNGYLFW